MALYYNGDNVSSINFTPQLTLAEYNALEIKPKYWIRTDAPESGTISANDISYDNTSSGLTGDTIQEAIDEVTGGLSDKYLIIEGGYITDINIPIADLPTLGILKNRVDNDTTNTPATGGAYVLSMTAAGNSWGNQIFVGDGGIYSRSIRGTVYSTWHQIGIGTDVRKWSYQWKIDTGTYTIQFKKCGLFTQVWFWCDKAITENTTIFNIPEAFRPYTADLYPQRYSFIDQLGKDSQMHIENNGDVKFGNTSTAVWRQWNFIYLNNV